MSAFVALLGLACGSGTDVTVSSAPVETSGPECEGIIERTNAHDALLGFETWLAIDDATVRRADSRGIPSSLAEEALQVPGPTNKHPFVVMDIRGTAVRGAVVQHATVDGVLGEQVHAALQRDREVWVAVAENPGLGGTRIWVVAEFDESGQVTFASDCESFLEENVRAAFEHLRSESGEDLAFPATEREFLTEVFRNPNGSLAGAWKRASEVAQPMSWWELREDVRPIDDPGFVPVEVAETVRSVAWQVELDQPIAGGDDWMVCPYTSPGWSSCLAFDALSTGVPADLWLMVPEGEDVVVEFWLVPFARPFEERDRVIATVPVTATDHAVSMRIGGASVDELTQQAGNVAFESAP